MPAAMDIALQRNEDWARTLKLTEHGESIDLFGMTVAMQVRDRLNQALVAQAEVTIPSLVAGEVGILLRAREGSALAAYGNPIQSVSLPYDCRLIDSSGIAVVLFAGNVIMSRGETKST